MKSTFTILILLSVMSYFAYLALYCRHDGKKKGMARPIMVLKYGSLVVVPILLVVGVFSFLR